MENYKIKFQVHRGVMTEAPENTMSAYRKAVEQGYQIIELDTKFTKDNKCVLLHDSTVNRTARLPDGSKLESDTPISSLTLEEARALDFGIAFSNEFKGEKIPTLEELLTLGKATGAHFKFDNVLERSTLEQQEIFFDTVERMDALECTQFVGTTIGFLERVIKRFPNAVIHFDGAVTDEILEKLPALAPRERLWVWIRIDNSETSWCKFPPITKELAPRVREIANLGVWRSITTDDIKLAKELYHADAIETDGRFKPDIHG